MSARDDAAVAAAVTEAVSIPDTLSANPFRPTPNSTRSVPNLAILFSPANQAATPPSLGIVLAMSANILPAVAAAVTEATSIPVTTFEN